MLLFGSSFKMLRCKTCKKVLYHLSLLHYVSAKYYTCFWCGNTLKNALWNRMEHGQRCNRKPNEICHCEVRCTRCMRYPEEKENFVYFPICGCSYCKQCNPGLATVNHGACNNCDFFRTYLRIREMLYGKP